MAPITVSQLPGFMKSDSYSRPCSNFVVFWLMTCWRAGCCFILYVFKTQVIPNSTTWGPFLPANVMVSVTICETFFRSSFMLQQSPFKLSISMILLMALWNFFLTQKYFWCFQRSVSCSTPYVWDMDHMQIRHWFVVLLTIVFFHQLPVPLRNYSLTHCCHFRWLCS